MVKKTIEETYQKLTQREHILLRSGMYIGQVKKQMEELWVPEAETYMMKKKIVEYSPGFMKIFDEILTNATDHSFNNSTVTQIKINYSQETGEISVFNNGPGIPVELHKEHNMYVPELIFGHLLSGSNYDDSDSRTGAGTNGIGSKAVSIFSKKFIVETCDGQKKFIQEHSENMTEKTKAKITSCKKSSYTKITFIPDYKRFDMESLEDDTISLINKRAIDCIACTASTVKIYLNDKLLKGKGMTDYTKYYFNEEKVYSESFSERVKNKKGEFVEYIWEYTIVPSEHYEQVSFVNGNATNQGGKHVDYIMYQIINKLKTMLETKKKLKELKPNFIKDKLFLFLRATVANPVFNSQTKDQLTTASKDFGCVVQVSDKFIERLYKSSITEEIVEFCKAKESIALAKTTDGSKKNRVFIPKLEDAIKAGTNQSNKCSLILTEGLSALTFALHGRSVIGPDYIGAFPLRGKALNVRDATIQQLTSNEEICNIKQILGLKEGKVYKNTDELRYGKVILLTDADCLTGDTPLLLKNENNEILTETIERLTSNYNKDDISLKEYGSSNLEIWSEKGWTKIISVIRHKVTKTIYRVLTHTGVIDVTEDHPLLKEDSTEIHVNKCVVGDKLLHNFPILSENKTNIPNNLENLDLRKDIWKLASKCKIPYYQSYNKMNLIKQLNIIKNLPSININNYNNINKDEAYVMGLFWADGSSGVYEWKYNYKAKNRPNEYVHNRITYSWAISNNNIQFLEKAKNILEKLYNLQFNIIECKTNRINKSYKLIINGGILTKDIVNKYTKLFYYNNPHKYKNGNKYIPKEILNSSREIREQFLIGYYNGDGKGHDISKQKELVFDVESKISANSLFILCKSLNYEVSINTRENKPNILTLCLTKGHQQWDKSKIKKIINLGKTDLYVYDLETENHHFQGGVGQMIVHNCDGSHIKALLINIFSFGWPSLLKLNPSFIQTIKTPILKAVKGKQIVEFFTEQDYHKWVNSSTNTNSYKIKYFKGLGSSTKEDAKDIFKRLGDLRVDYYYKDQKCEESILLAFDKDKNTVKLKKKDEDTETDDGSEIQELIKCSDRRKNWLSNYDKNSYIDMKQTKISFQELINKELIHFSIYDNSRSIPSLCDGLKPSQRKILHYMLKKNIIDVIKVAQLSGYVSAECGYHHGEVSLQGAIIGMAQDYTGSNNINLLYPDGNFGTAYLQGKDSASPRYIFTRLSDITSLIFNKLDLPLLNYLNDDGLSIEPEHFMPIISMILVNGCSGIGTGYSTFIPPYNPIDIIENLLRVLNDDLDPLPMKPWYRGFNGTIEEVEEGKYVSKGKWQKVSDTQLKITELPVGMGITTYKEYLESLIENNVSIKRGDKKATKNKVKKVVLKDVRNLTADENDAICFIIEFKEAKNLDDLIKTETLEKELKLTKSFSTNNMYLFNQNMILTKYKNPNDILLEFYDLRLDYYQLRKEYLEKKLNDELVILQAKMRFIKAYIDSELDINRKSKQFIVDLLKKNKYPLHEESYDYLLNLQVYAFTEERISKLENECDKKQTELKFIQSKSNADLWISDLKILSEKLS